LEFDKENKSRGEADIKTIAFKIAENKIADFLRRKYKDKELLRADYIRMAAEPSRQDVQAFLTEIINGANELTPPQSQAFLLCGLAGLSSQEAAKISQTTHQRINKNYREAKKIIINKLFEDNKTAFFKTENQVAWLDNFYTAFIDLTTAAGILDPGLKWQAEGARIAILRKILRDKF
jgi:hypothetical protein